MKLSQEETDGLLTKYFSGFLTDSEKVVFDTWIKDSPENEATFKQYASAWESLSLLSEMEKYDSFEALKTISAKMGKTQKIRWLAILQRVAAILLLPLLTYTVFKTYQKDSYAFDQEMMQKVSSRPGMVSQFVLEDGTKVWLNSGSELEFPLHFSHKNREVKLKGEAFFEVTKNKEKPFRVIASNSLNIDVLGTSFNVVSFEEDSLSEIVLVEGEVSLSSPQSGKLRNFGSLFPRQKAVYDKRKQRIVKNTTEVDKYIAWREGFLIFRDDTMEDVIKRLSRWFNVEIFLDNEELKGYTFKATFKEESLLQVLNLLKLSSPIDYKISQRKLLPNGEFTKQKVHIMKKTE